jgi:hypothetical protein
MFGVRKYKGTGPRRITQQSWIVWWKQKLAILSVHHCPKFWAMNNNSLSGMNSWPKRHSIRIQRAWRRRRRLGWSAWPWEMTGDGDGEQTGSLGYIALALPGVVRRVQKILAWSGPQTIPELGWKNGVAHRRLQGLDDPLCGSSSSCHGHCLFTAKLHEIIPWFYHQLIPCTTVHHYSRAIRKIAKKHWFTNFFFWGGLYHIITRITTSSHLWITTSSPSPWPADHRRRPSWCPNTSPLSASSGPGRLVDGDVSRAQRAERG